MLLKKVGASIESFEKSQPLSQDFNMQWKTRRLKHPRRLQKQKERSSAFVYGESRIVRDNMQHVRASAAGFVHDGTWDTGSACANSRQLYKRRSPIIVHGQIHLA